MKLLLLIRVILRLAILIVDHFTSGLPLTASAGPKCPLRSWCMAIYRLLRRQVFEPEDICLLAIVFEDVLKTLGLLDRKDPRTELIARKLVDLAQAGERDPECLKDLTLEVIQKPQ